MTRLQFRLRGKVLQYMLTLYVGATTSFGQVLITDRAAGGRIGLYEFDGTPINANLVTGIDLPRGIAISGSNIFVALPNLARVAEYNLAGATINSSLISGVGAMDVAVSGSYLYVGNYGTSQWSVGQYNLDGSVVNASLVSGAGHLFSLSVTGSEIYVASRNGATNEGKIGKYSIDGTTLNDSLITGFAYPYGLDVSGSYIYVSNGNEGANNGVRKYTLDGTLIDKLIEPSVPSAVAASDSHLYVSTASLAPLGYVGKYTIDGAVVAEKWVTGLQGPEGIATISKSASTSVPDAAETHFLVLLGIVGVLALRRFCRFQPGTG